MFFTVLVFKEDYLSCMLMTKSITVMVNISTNINETDSHLWTQIPAEHKTNPRHMVLEVKVLGWDGHTKYQSRLF